MYTKTNSKAHTAYLMLSYGASISNAQKLTGLSLRRVKVISKVIKKVDKAMIEYGHHLERMALYNALEASKGFTYRSKGLVDFSYNGG